MRRGYKTWTTVRAAVTALALYAGVIALNLLLGAAPALGLAVLTLAGGPACLMVTALTAGMVPMLGCLALLLAVFALTGPWLLTACAALYLLPALAVYAWCLSGRIPFWRAVGLTAGALAVSQAAILLLLQSRTQGQMYLAAGNLAAQAVNGTAYRDSLLYSLVSAGLLRVPASMADSAVVAVPGGYALSSEVLGELLLQVRGGVQELLRSLVPSLLVTGSGLNALLGLSLGIRYGTQAAQKRAFRRDEPLQEIPDLSMPPLRAWHLPRPWGLRVGVLGLGYFLVRAGGNQTMIMLGALMFQVFALCFGVQGLAALNDSQHKRGTGRGWRGAAVVLALLLRIVQIALIVVGVIDQISNARGLRPPMRPRNEEEK